MGRPDHIRILSAGAPKEGVRRCAEVFKEKSGADVAIEFATAPVIHERVIGGCANADIVVAPNAAMAGFAEGRQVIADSISVLGSIAAGVAVRDGSPEPDLSGVESFRDALLAVDSLIYNRASSGRSIEAMIDSLGIADAVADKTVRVATGAAVMEYLAGDKRARNIGFGQITEIRLHEHLGVHLVGPLPAEVAKVTTYAAGVFSNASQPERAASLVAFMASPEGKRIFAETGVT